MFTRENLESEHKNTVGTFLLLLPLGSGQEELVRSVGGIQEAFADLALRTGPSCPTFGRAVGIFTCVQSWSRRVSIRRWLTDAAGIVPVVATTRCQRTAHHGLPPRPCWCWELACPGCPAAWLSLLEHLGQEAGCSQGPLVSSHSMLTAGKASAQPAGSLAI